MRSLYQCGNARCQGKLIACSEGHPLSPRKDGTIDTIRLVRGEPLEFKICQECADYDHMGDPVPKEERGWLNAS
jgi:hypothetical protein